MGPRLSRDGALAVYAARSLRPELSPPQVPVKHASADDHQPGPGYDGLGTNEIWTPSHAEVAMHRRQEAAADNAIEPHEDQGQPRQQADDLAKDHSSETPAEMSPT